MVLHFQDKQTIVAQVRQVAKKALSAVVADSCGVQVVQINELRKSGRKAGIDMRVVRNTLMRRVVAGTPFACLTDTFIGPTLIAFSHEHPGAAARLFKDFANKNTHFKIKIAVFEGKLIDASQIASLATIPTYNEAIAHMMTTIQEVCAVKLMRTLSLIRKQRCNLL